MQKKVSLFWFRRDLRLDDNAGLQAALKGDFPVLPIFVFDPEILDQLPSNDARVSFIHNRLTQLSNTLKLKFKSGISFYYGKPVEVFTNLIKQYDLQAVYTNRDYEPYAVKRDRAVAGILAKNSIEFKTFKDQVIFEKDEIIKKDGTPYVVFTPYMRSWKAKFNAEKCLKPFDTAPLLKKLIRADRFEQVSLSEMGFTPASIQVQNYKISPEFIAQYEARRNFPAVESGTSKLGPHLRFGTVSVRSIIQAAIASKNDVFWNELIWRAFFMQILWHFPHTVNSAFRPKYDRIKWRNNPEEFKLWTEGKTGYALVDAGMRELNTTGYMHNRIRMLVASFLCKHLLIDWRWGEAYFAEKLLDFELASNVGNWQWAAGCGVDAAPYFRIFNPMTQIKKFDKDLEYIMRWVPDLQELSYPSKIVDHKLARERCLAVYKEALQ